MKELPATLLLQPFNFTTLATALYGEAKRGTYEDGAIAALAIVLVGLIPVIVLARVNAGIAFVAALVIRSAARRRSARISEAHRSGRLGGQLQAPEPAPRRASPACRACR